MRRKVFAWLLAGCMLVGVAAEPFDEMRVSAAEVQEEPEENEVQMEKNAVYGQLRSSDNLKYGDFSYRVLDDGTVEITDYSTTGTAETVAIPSEIEGRKVTSIGDFAFQSCDSLIRIEIPEGVTNIGKYAFSFSDSLTGIEISKSVTSIGDYAFDGCSSLAEIEIPERVTSIGKYAFGGCSSLTEIEIPEGVTSIGDNAFGRCSSLTEITVSENNQYYVATEGVLFSKNVDLLVCYPQGKEGSTYIIPASVTSIGGYAFFDCSSLTEIEIPEGVTSIGDDAFAGCSSLIGITIPEGVTSIGDGAFSDCSSLTGITIPESVMSIGRSAFQFCIRLTAIMIPSGVASIGNNAFYASGLTEIAVSEKNPYYSAKDGVLFNKTGDRLIWCLERKTGTYNIPDGVTSIEAWGFEGCWLTAITVPGSVTSIGDRAFVNCHSLKSITVAEESPYYFVKDDVLFSKTDGRLIKCLEGKTGVYNIPEGVTSIENGAFDDCRSLTEVMIPKGVTSIGDWAFLSCSGLTEIIIPEGVTSIGIQAFDYCNSLTKITIPSSVTNMADGTAFMSLDKEKLTIRCVKNSYAHKFAVNYGFKVEFYDDSPLDTEETESTEQKPTTEGTESTESTGGVGSTEATGEQPGTTGNTESTESTEDSESTESAESLAAKVTGITITADAKQIAAGKKVHLTAQVTPQSAADRKVSWSSGNKKYATVNASGVVTTKKAGAGRTVTITATAKDGSGVKASIKIKIMKDVVKQVKITNAKKTLKAGKSMKLKAEVTTSGKGANKKLKWSSSNTKYATVNANGKVTVKKAGKGKTVTITASSTDGSNKKAKVKIKIR